MGMSRLLQNPPSAPASLSVSQFFAATASRSGVPVLPTQAEFESELGINAWLPLPLNQLSFGMWRLVQLAAVTRASPAVLLLDEPFSGIDARRTGAVVRLLEALRLERSVVLVTGHRPLPFAVDQTIEL
jgi:energy-coupling factor transporter ATP-binding protein EcfA2